MRVPDAMQDAASTSLVRQPPHLTEKAQVEGELVIEQGCPQTMYVHCVRSVFYIMYLSHADSSADTKQYGHLHTCVKVFVSVHVVS